MKNYLLMTATVTPPAGELLLTRIVPAQRLQDYTEALKFYLDEQNSYIDGVIFVDNSGHSLEELRLIAQDYLGSKQIEILSFFGLDYPVEYGRGYGELKLIEYAYLNSKIMQAMKEDDRFWKVTGRLQVTTIKKIIKLSSAYFDLCADFRCSRGHVDTRLIAFSIAGYKKYIYGRFHELPGLIIETWLFNKLTPLLSTKEGANIQTEFKMVAKFKGFSGDGNFNYMAPKQQFIYFCRSVYLAVKYLFKH
ncbi:MAG: hypothetical protein Q8M99_09570 [Methylotenera sp.]|nr:hypothetical protein [Methylotenera sp.]